ncbi:MAG: MFS transporter, partial [Candidatus Latescibacterota bacterium]
MSGSAEPAGLAAPEGGSARLPANRDFLLLLGGQTISSFGDIIFDITLTLWIAVDLASGRAWAPMAVSGVLLAASLPVLVVGPIAGVFVDRWDRRRTMLVTDGLRAALVALLLLGARDGLPVAGRLAAIYAVVFLVSVCSQFFSPARVAVIVEVVDEPQRAQASSVSQLMSSLAVVIGPALAAPLFFRVGAAWALALNALSFVVSLAAILALRHRPAQGASGQAAVASFSGEFAAGLRFFAGSAVLRTMLIAA